MLIDILLFAAFAVFIGVKLFNALGKRDYNHDISQGKPNVVPFPDAKKEQAVDVKFEEVKDDTEELEKKLGPEIAGKIKKIRQIDPTFSENFFLKGARSAFEMILKAFASGDKNTLKNLLSADIYKGFTSEIDKREKSDKVAETTLVSILASNIKSIVLEKKYAKIVVEIVSEQINIVKNKQGEVVEGNPSHVNKVCELWTFARNLGSKNPNWELVATSDAK